MKILLILTTITCLSPTYTWRQTLDAIRQVETGGSPDEGRGATGNETSSPIPPRPATRLPQNGSWPTPIGEITPTPVITTRAASSPEAMWSPWGRESKAEIQSREAANFGSRFRWCQPRAAGDEIDSVKAI